jgi:microcystin-dependent protein
MFANFSYNVAPNADDNGGGGGGGGNITNNALPLGVVVPYAGVISGSAPYLLPADWLLCDGAEYRNDTIYEGLYNLIGFTFGVAPNDTVQTGIGAYSYGGTANTITFTATTANLFMKAGTIVRPSGFTLTTGEDINGTYVLVSSAPAIGGTGTVTGTFVQPITGTGSGNASGTYNVNRASFATPNMVSKFPLGASYGGSPVPTSTGGSATQTLTITNLPPHSHTLWVGGADASQGSVNTQKLGFPNVDTGAATGGTIYAATNTPTSGSRTQQVGQDGTGQTSFSTLNPYLALYYIIHAKN